MLCQNLCKSSGVENQLVNHAELSELLMGSGLGAAAVSHVATGPDPTMDTTSTQLRERKD